MRPFSHICLVVKLVLLLYPLAVMGAPIELEPGKTSYTLIDTYPVEYFVDKTRKLSEKEIALQVFTPYPLSKEFMTTDTNFFNLWMKFQIHNPLTEKINLLGNIDSPRGFNLYFDDGQTIQLLKTTNVFNIAELQINPLSTATLYIKWPYELRSDWRFLPITFQSNPAQFAQGNLAYYFTIGVTYGVLIGLLLYTIFVFILTFDTNYLLYILIILSMFPAALNNDNILSGIFGTNYNYYNMLYIPILYIIGGFTYTLFTTRVLQAKIYTKRLYFIAKIYLMFSFPVFILLWFLCLTGVIHTWVLYQSIAGVYAIIGLLISSLICLVEMYYRLYPPAAYYFLGILSSTGGYAIQFLASFSFIPYNFFTMNFGRFGVTLDFMLQSVVLAAYINTIKQKEATTQLALIQEQRKLVQTKEVSLKRKRKLIRAYERFFPHRFLEILGKRSVVKINLGDQSEKEMVIVFSDIRNFTTLLEHMSPQESFNFINDYLAKAGPLIRKYRGFVDKYIGDSIMALFDDTRQAIDASLSMCKVIQDQSFVNEVSSKINIGIGIHYGSLILGTIGEIKRMDATVISDAVNTASRLESLNKVFNTSIIISEEALLSLREKNDLHIRFLDDVEVKGKSQSHKIYEIYNMDEVEIINKKIAIQATYDKALELYRAANFKDALNIFLNCQQTLPDDKVIQIYIARCKELDKLGITAPWNPVTHLSLKVEASYGANRG